MPGPKHSQQVIADGLHSSIAYTYANAAARLAATGFTSSDLYKQAIQLDDFTMYILVATTPTWADVGNAALSPTLNKVVIQVRKASPGTINKGEAVRVVGFDSGLGLPLVELAQANSVGTIPCSGIAYEAITDSATKLVMIEGWMDGIDTSALTANAPVYLSASVLGGLTTTAPTGNTNFVQPIGICLNSDTSPDGRIGVNILSLRALAMSAPQAVGTAAIGASNLAAREDHVHAHGNQLGGSLHANVIAAGAAGFMSGADKTKLDGVNIIPARLTVAATGDANYTTIKAAVDAATGLGASLSNPYHVVVAAGTYTEAAFTMADGINISSMAGVNGGVIIVASDPTNDLITMNGGNLNGLTLRGVTTAGKAMIRSANPAALSAVYYCGFQNCANGWVIQGGAPGGGTVVTSNITGAGLAVTESVIKVTGAGSKLSLLGAFFNVPSAVLPAYAGNPIQNAVTVDLGASADIVAASFGISPKNNTQVSVLVDNGATLSLLSSTFTVGETAIQIGAGGSGSKVSVLGCRLLDHVTKFKSLSSTGVFNVSATVDTHTTSLVAGAVFNGTISVTSTGESVLIGDVVNDFDSGRSLSLDHYLYDAAASGTHRYETGTSGGLVTDAGGLNVAVTAGDGWVRRETDEDVEDVAWATVASLALTASATNYVYLDATTLAVTAGTSPPSPESISFATVYTTGSAIRYIHNTLIVANNAPAHLTQYLLATRKFALSAGLACAQGGTNRKLSVTAGSYFRGFCPISLVGGTDVTFSAFYNAGAGELTAQTLLDITQYDNAGTLTAMTASYYRADSVLITSDNRVSVIFGTAQYSTQVAAEAALFAVIPTFLQESGFKLARVVVQQGVGIASVTDARPQPGVSGGGGSAGVSDHGLLSGLGDDDHTQYLLTTGARVMTGSLNAGGYSVTNVNLVDGVDVSAHGALHQPGGADAIATAAANTVTFGAAAAGSAASLARSDHNHALTAPAAPTQITVATAAAGTSVNVARQDHVHSVATAVAGSLAVGATAAAGASTSLARADHTHGFPAPAAPATVGTANATGASSNVARQDHVHAHGDQTIATLHAIATTGANGFMSSTDKTKLDGIAGGAGIFGSEAQRLEQGTTLSTTAGSYQQYMRLNVTSIPAGTYRIGWTYAWSLSSTSQNFVSRVYVDSSTTLLAHVQEPQDTSSGQRNIVSGFAYATFGGAGTHTIDIDYYASSGATASVHLGTIEIWRVS